MKIAGERILHAKRHGQGEYSMAHIQYMTGIEIIKEVYMKKRVDSDERYILDLISSILNCPYVWQKTFPDLLGDIGKSGKQKNLPVGSYFKEYNLIVEYRETQHYKAVHFMDKRMTIRGVPRGVQRTAFSFL